MCSAHFYCDRCKLLSTVYSHLLLSCFALDHTVLEMVLYGFALVSLLKHQYFVNNILSFPVYTIIHS